MPYTADRMRKDFSAIAQLLTWLFAFAGLSLFAEGLYRPIKRLVVGVTGDQAGVLADFHNAALPLLPALLLLCALWQGKRLFEQMANGALLSAVAARHLRHAGDWIIWSATTGLITGEVVHGAQSGWAFMIGLGVIGMTFRNLANVLDHAAAIQADLDQIV